ncbi:hypothetical protein OK074_1063 [Actinobacteria bacterium OK074]|nr:hypothetical protein OK074_1063 [Actinobacteria bacterium OK074]
MLLHQALDRCRTLVVEGRDGVGRARPLAELARHGYAVRRPPAGPHHLDPTRPYRELLAGEGRLALDGGIVHELVYGPLRRGRCRVTWIQALDFAESVAERDGALLHLTTPGQPSGPAEEFAAADAYERALRTLAQHVPVVSVDAAQFTRQARAPARTRRELGLHDQQLTVRWNQTA